MQGIIQYGNLPDFISGSMTLTQGISPSVATIETPPLPITLPPISELRISFGGTVIRFPGAALDKIEPVGDSEGRVRVKITILDRRWIWRETGAISGFYNLDTFAVRDALNGQTAKPNVKTLRELMELCLDALDEPDYIISPFINGGDDSYPAVEWDYQRPAEALADLCDRSNNIVTLGLDNRIRIFARGQGEQLPTANLIESQTSTDAPEAPQSIVIVGAKDKYQFDLILDPVGRELDGTVKPINELSYAPRINGQPDWSENDYELHSRVPSRFRQLAKETVWKWYRVRLGFTLHGGEGITVNDLSEITPLLDFQVETYENDEGRVVPRPAWVFGKYSPLRAKLLNDDPPQQRLSNQPESLYIGSFSIDAERGIVVFSEPIVWLTKTKQGGFGPTQRGLFAYAPDIRLRIALNYNPKGYEGWKRTEYFKDEQPNGATTSTVNSWVRYIIDETIERNVYYDFENNKLEDNKQANETKARKVFDTAVAEYRAFDTAASATYAGILAVPCDGAISQVTWDIGESGARTRISRNREETFITPSYAERRTFERIDAQLRRKQ